MVAQRIAMGEDGCKNSAAADPKVHGRDCGWLSVIYFARRHL